MYIHTYIYIYIYINFKKQERVHLNHLETRKAPAGEYRAEPVRAKRMPMSATVLVEEPRNTALIASVRYFVVFPSTSKDVADRMSLCGWVGGWEGGWVDGWVGWVGWEGCTCVRKRLTQTRTDTEI
jgi:hypothetical protein